MWLKHINNIQNSAFFEDVYMHIFKKRNKKVGLKEYTLYKKTYPRPQ